VNKNDGAAVQKMFPADGGWDFELAPPIDALLKRGRAGTTTDIRYASYSDLPNRVELRELLRQFKGIHLIFSAPLRRAASPTTHRGRGQFGFWRQMPDPFSGRQPVPDFVNMGRASSRAARCIGLTQRSRCFRHPFVTAILKTVFGAGVKLPDRR